MSPRRSAADSAARPSVATPRRRRSLDRDVPRRRLTGRPTRIADASLPRPQRGRGRLPDRRADRRPLRRPDRGRCAPDVRGSTLARAGRRRRPRGPRLAAARPGHGDDRRRPRRRGRGRGRPLAGAQGRRARRDRHVRSGRRLVPPIASGAQPPSIARCSARRLGGAGRVTGVDRAGGQPQRPDAAAPEVARPRRDRVPRPPRGPAPRPRRGRRPARRPRRRHRRSG